MCHRLERQPLKASLLPFEAEVLAILEDLDMYVGRTGWIQSYVPYYSAIMQLLRDRKTWLLSQGPRKERQVKFYTERTPFDNVTDMERESFSCLQVP
jgi:hypothetical protein